ncbi:MAG: hypothetical protein ACRCTQ_05840 [Brevinemataceae bacterium]
MSDNSIRKFITYSDNTHPLLQEMPEMFQNIWFKSYKDTISGNKLFLAMERIFEDPSDSLSRFFDVLTFEIADMEMLLEWDEEYPDKPFTALDPYYIFFDGINLNQGLFSLGNINLKTMQFDPELEIFISVNDNRILIDFQDDTQPIEWVENL